MSRISGTFFLLGWPFHSLLFQALAGPLPELQSLVIDFQATDEFIPD